MKSKEISIITPCLNRAQFVDNAIKSVLKQNYKNVEHIIIDGGSTDGTLDRLAQYPSLRVISGPDKGMYDALNKGVRLANGEIIGFLNTDDQYSANVFQEVADLFDDVDIEAVAGEALIFTENPKGEQAEIATFSPSPPATLLRQVVIGAPIFNAWFFRKTVFSTIGDFNSAFRISGDAEFLLRLTLQGFKYAIVKRPIYQYRQHEGSLTMQLDVSKLLKIIDEHFALSVSYRSKPNVPKELRRYLRQLYAQTCFELSRKYSIKGETAKSIWWAIASFFSDSAWLMKTLCSLRCFSKLRKLIKLSKPNRIDARLKVDR